MKAGNGAVRILQNDVVFRRPSDSEIAVGQIDVPLWPRASKDHQLSHESSASFKGPPGGPSQPPCLARHVRARFIDTQAGPGGPLISLLGELEHALPHVQGILIL